ncbi:hypothetical protein [Pedobacter sp. KLB.chiD]|uniref:hypothetical protein n=1 Tax=Pedobacter sp. KLB.chiD TaxID=3387402 RepID=UPI00399C0A87
MENNVPLFRAIFSPLFCFNKAETAFGLRSHWWRLVFIADQKYLATGVAASL